MITATIRNVVVAAMLQVTVLTAAAIFSFPAQAADPVLKIDNFTFDPTKLTVKVGTTVTWYNEDDIPHAIASSTKVFKSKALNTDDKFSFTFSTPGVYEYFCSVHPHMTGAIVVEAGAADATGQ